MDYLMGLQITLCVMYGLVTFQESCAEAVDWKYGTDWAQLYPDSCGRKRQSPINILTEKLIVNPRLQPLEMIDYDDTPKDQKWKITHGDNTVTIKADFESPPQLAKGGFGEKYTFVKIHLHWSANDSAGSEHRIDGRQYPLEMHLVHRKKFKTLEDAKKDPDGLAVIGVFFELTENPDEVNTGIDTLMAGIRNASETNATVAWLVPGLTLADLCPRNLSYYRYNGSLTIPTCDEAVVWTVLMTPQKITHNQLRILRSTWNETFGDTFRPVQDIGNRTVEIYRALNEAPATTLPPVSSSTRSWSELSFCELAVFTAILSVIRRFF